MNTTQENSAAARAIASELAARTGVSFSAAWNQTRQSHPHLYGMAENPDPIHNRAGQGRFVSAERAEAVVQNLQSGDEDVIDVARRDGRMAEASEEPREMTLTQYYQMGRMRAPNDRRVSNRGRMVLANSQPASIHAELSPSDLEDAIATYRQQVRERGRELSYSGARNQLRQSKPGLFGC